MSAPSPMFEQFHRIKAQCPNALLFFRMGDFYELFFDDARVAARELDLTLTTRNKDDPEPIPMAGVPHHSAGPYIQKLTDAGYRVAIADQMEDPKAAKGLVKRELVRVVTPGMPFDPTQLDQRAPNWLAAIAAVDGRFGVALLDGTTGALKCTDVPGLDAAGSEIRRLEAREVLLGPGVDAGALRRWTRGILVSAAPPGAFGDAGPVARVTGRSAEAWGLSPAERSAVAGALAYGLEMSGGNLGNVLAVERYATSGFMGVDETTQRNLELLRTLRTGQRKGSLIHLLDRTVTAMGGRMLREWLAFPLLDPAAIHRRSAGVEALCDDELRARVRSALAGVADLERIAARVTQRTVNARELVALGRSLSAVPELFAACADSRLSEGPTPDLAQDVRADIQSWLVDEPPVAVGEGGLIRDGAHPELDALIRRSLDGVGELEALEAREREASGIGSLKIKRNNVFGHYFEVTRANLHKVPSHWIRKQTIANGERYFTLELKELEDGVIGADERRKRLELELFAALRERVAASVDRVLALARRVARLDALAGLAEVAVDRGWVRPVVDDSREIEVRGGRHPVVEASLDEERFVPNDVLLDAGSELVVLTGPNMAGKSTVMRQAALIALLAQVGSFVPASSARIGWVDRIFTRVGASDDLGRGQSTFMVEMAETATILREATERSLVLLDEIGRGTSTYDGLSIAWAVAEQLADQVRARTLFATHYHELCDLAETRDNVVNRSIAVAEHGDGVVFLRRLKEGGASRSYGIQCARLAGIPDPVITRARALLARFEKHAPRNERQQLSLFGALRDEPEPAPADPRLAALQGVLDALDPDALSPREAHEVLYRLKMAWDAGRG